MVGMGPFQYRILIAAGLCFAADSMEVLLLSFLAIVLKAQWNLNDTQTATLTSSVFIGAMLGTLILGPLGDSIGRKIIFLLTAAIIAVFGFATAAASDFSTLLLCRFMVGFGVGGLTVPFDTLAEFIPTSHRGSNLLIIEYFWTFGTLITPLLAYISLGQGDGSQSENAWRLFVILCAIPCLLSTVIGFIYVPESPRWLMTRGQSEKALGILKKAALRNGKNPNSLFPDGTRLVHDAEEESTSFMDLFSPKWRRITIFLWLAWAGFAFTYYGTIIVITKVFASTEDGSEKASGSYSFDYGAIFASASAELAGTTLVLFTIDRLGRIPTQTVSYLLGGVSVFVLCALASVDMSRSRLVASAFCARLFYMAATCTTWVSTAELLTTEIRSTGHSASNAVARIGGAFSPYLVTSSAPFPIVGTVLLGVSLVTAYATWNLPETTGKRMGSVKAVNDLTNEATPASYGIV